MIEKETGESGKVKISRGSFLPFMGLAAMLGIFVTLFILWSYTTYGDIRSGWLRLNGYHLMVEQYLLDLGAVPAGESRSGTFRLKNLTGSSLVILGVQSDCSCLTTAELPITIPASGVCDFDVLFSADNVPLETVVVRQMILHISVDQPIQLLEIKATITPNPKENQNDP